MKAIGYKQKGDVNTLVAFEANLPNVGHQDLLVQVKAVSVNPVDCKVRKGMDPEPSPRILGLDAAGIVEQVGPGVTNFQVGDHVYYAGDITRPGSNAEYQVVHQDIVGTKPSSLSFPKAAALPLTTITAWELLFDCFPLRQGEGQGDTLLVLGAAGGVGSILIQLAKALTKMTVVATASRDKSMEWVKEFMGADHVINHNGSLKEQLAILKLTPRYVAGLNGTDGHFESIVDLIQPRGHIAIIDDVPSLDLAQYPNFKRKALTLSWEFMFARSMLKSDDMKVQHDMLNRVSELVDSGTLKTTVTETLGPLTVDVLQKAHAKQESGTTIGKTVIQGFA